MSESDNKENPVVKEEETNDTEVFEEAVVEVARLSKEGSISSQTKKNIKIKDINMNIFWGTFRSHKHKSHATKRHALTHTHTHKNAS